MFYVTFVSQIFHVYSRKHSQKAHGAYAKLGDRVMVAIMGQKKKAIIVGMKQKQVLSDMFVLIYTVPLYLCTSVPLYLYLPGS